MTATENDLKALSRIRSEMAEAFANGEQAAYFADQGEYILHVLTMMTYERGAGASGQGTAA